MLTCALFHLNKNTMEIINELIEMYKLGCMVIVSVLIFAKAFLSNLITIKFKIKNPFINDTQV